MNAFHVVYFVARAQITDFLAMHYNILRPTRELQTHILTYVRNDLEVMATP